MNRRHTTSGVVVFSILCSPFRHDLAFSVRDKARVSTAESIRELSGPFAHQREHKDDLKMISVLLDLREKADETNECFESR
jgi:hypothetical protein